MRRLQRARSLRHPRVGTGRNGNPQLLGAQPAPPPAGVCRDKSRALLRWEALCVHVSRGH